MSELSKKPGPTVTESASGVTAPGASGQRASNAVKIWATVGAVFLAYTLYVFVRWVTGPYFEPVGGGPSEPPLYMEIPLIANAVVLWIGMPVALWFFPIRPWLREKRITLDGMLLMSMALMMFQDPMLNYYSTWCTYNAWLWNRVPWAPHIPGWVAHEEPGHGARAAADNIPGYMFGVLLLTIVGCAVMRKIKNRWPGISNLRLVLVTYAIAIAFDFVMEGLILLPIGFYSYPGAIQSLSINAGTYYQWPIYEGHVGRCSGGAMLPALLHRRPGTHRRRTRNRPYPRRIRQTTVRSLPGDLRRGERLLLIFYNVPATWLGMHGDAWPRMSRSARTSTPASAVREPTGPAEPRPAAADEDSGYIDTDGELVLPDGVELPAPVPIRHGS